MIQLTPQMLQEIQKSGLSQFGDVDKLIQQVNDQIMCGPECQRSKKLDALNEKYRKAKENVEEGPNRLETAKRNYYEFKDGPVEYRQQQRSRYETEVAKLISEMRKKQKERTEEIESRILEHNAVQVYAQNMNDLLDKYISENQRLTRNIEQYEGDIFTQERKTQYIDESLWWKDLVAYIARIFYWIILIVFIFYFILFKGNYTNRRLLVLGLLGLILPTLIAFFIRFQVFGISVEMVINRIVDLFRPSTYK